MALDVGCRSYRESMSTELSNRDAELLAFESRWPVHSGAKESAIQTQLGLGAVDYYLRLNNLMVTRSALAHDPILVGRLLRIRNQRLRARSQRVSRSGL
jgi:hypothetical protein